MTTPSESTGEDARNRARAADEATDRARATVVAVHGLWMRGAVMKLLLRRMKLHGFDVRAFEYPSIRDDLETNAARLARFVAGVPGDTVHLLGHSLGCVVILAMLERHALERPGRIVCLGPPFAGSVTAERVARLPGGSRVVGRSLGDLLARGGIKAAAPGRDVGVIAGRLPIGLGRLFGSFAGPNDGMVAVAETTVEGAADHIVLPVAHMSLLWAPSVAREVVHFLRAGRFDRT